METKKNLKMKHWILGIIFVVTGVLTFLTMELEAEEASYTTMSQASLPIVYFKTDAGNSYNALPSTRPAWPAISRTSTMSSRTAAWKRRPCTST